MTNEYEALTNIVARLDVLLDTQSGMAAGMGVVVFVCGFCVAAVVLVVGAGR